MAEQDSPHRRSTSDTVSLLIAIYLLVLTTALVGGGAWLWSRSAKPVRTTEASACWRIQEADGRVFKLNACTGETIEIVQERKPTTGA